MQSPEMQPWPFGGFPAFRCLITKVLFYNRFGIAPILSGRFNYKETVNEHRCVHFSCI